MLVLVGLTIHRYLTVFWEQGILPYSFGFLLFVKLFVLDYLVAFIWMFGVVGGVIVAAFCLLQVVYSAGLWAFSLPWLINMYRNPRVPRVNRLIYGGFSYLVMLIGVLTVANFFVSPYRSMWELTRHNMWAVLLVWGGILIVGNVARLIVMSRIVRDCE